MAAMTYPEIAFAVLCFLLLCYRNWYLKGPKSSLPTNWPVIGMMPWFAFNLHRIYDRMTEILQQNGGTIEFKGPWFSNMNMVITADPNNANYILSKRFSNFPKGPEFRKIFDILGDGILSSDFELWETQRRIIISSMKTERFQRFLVRTTRSKLENGLILVLDAVAKRQAQVDLQELFQRFTFDSTCTVVLGHDPACLSVDFPAIPLGNSFANSESAIFYRHVLPEWLWKLQKWLRIGLEGKLSRAWEDVDHFLAKAISLKEDMIKSKAETEQGFDLLTVYLAAYDEEMSASDTKEKFLRDNLLSLVIAGRDTISAALTWLFSCLATNPTAEDKIWEEIKTHLNLKDDEGMRVFDLKEVNELVYLHGALCETLRLFPPIALQHKAPIEPEILPSGHCIKRNMKTLLSFYSMGRMETIWGKDCLEFKPERWISEQGRIKHEPSFKFVAFNAGPRSCLGKDMSFVQMKMVAATVIYNYRVQVINGHHPISPCNSVILHKSDGLKVRITKRSAG